MEYYIISTKKLNKMRIDIHTHSSYSDGANFPGDMIKHAKRIGLDGIAITDHDEIKGTLEALEYDSEDFIVIPGIEVSAKEGHILGLNVREMIEPDSSAKDTIERIHELGGLAVAVHPYDGLRSGVGDLIYKLDFDAIEIFNGHTIFSSKNMKKIVGDINLPLVGGSDAHRLDEIGCISILVGNDPLNSIKRGEVEIEVNASKLKVLKNYLQRRFRRLI